VIRQRTYTVIIVYSLRLLNYRFNAVHFTKSRH